MHEDDLKRKANIDNLVYWVMNAGRNYVSKTAQNAVDVHSKEVCGLGGGECVPVVLEDFRGGVGAADGIYICD